MIPLFLFFSCLKFTETSAEDSFAYYACCSKQGTLRYFRKSELSLSEKDFFGDCVFCVGESCFERELLPGFWYIQWLYSRCSPRRKPGGWAWDSYHRSPQTGPSLCHSESLFSLLSGCIPFSSVCLSPSTVLEQLGISVYGRKFSWCET